MKIVLDTNVFVAGAFKRGSASGKILELVKMGDLMMMWHEKTRNETEIIVKKIPPTRRMWNDFAKLFTIENELKKELDLGALQFIEDPDDRKFFALAKQARAILITNDDHLLVHKDATGVEIVTSGEFVKSL